MRNVNKPITINEYRETVKIATKQEIIAISEDKNLKTINVKANYYDESGEFVSESNFIIEGDAYDLIMSEAPTFAPNKPLNEYREEDLWHIIDTL